MIVYEPAVVLLKAVSALLVQPVTVAVFPFA